MIDENINRDGYTLEDITAPRYKIGDLARIFDVTTETIRYYERIGIIKAYRSESGTRYFDATSVITIFLLRYKQVCGFENYEIVNQQRKSTLKEMEEAIIRKKEQLERERILLDYRIKKAETAMKEINHLMYRLNEFNIEECPEIVMWDFWEEFQVAECNYVEAGLLKNYFSLTKIGFNTIWHSGKTRFTPADRNYGLMMEKELADNLEIDISQCSRIIPSQKCLTVSISDLGGYMVDQLSMLAAKISLDTKIVAPPWGTVEMETYVSGERVWYFKIYFPIS